MDDKKKLLVLGVLFLAMMGVGVFQLTKGDGTPPPPTTPAGEKKSGADKPEAKADAAKAQPLPELKNPVVANAYSGRDPFKPFGAVEKAQDPKVEPKKEDAAPPKPAPVPTLSGKIPALPPLQIDTSGKLPSGEIAPMPGGAKALPLPEPSFGFKLGGVVLGDQPAAVFVDAQGAEKIVAVGHLIDGSARLISVTQGGATVRFNGKVLKLTPGGNESGN